MSKLSPNKQLQSWIRTHHLICQGTDFIFETVDQMLIERFESCLNELGGKVLSVKDVGHWPMGSSPIVQNSPCCCDSSATDVQ